MAAGGGTDGAWNGHGLGRRCESDPGATPNPAARPAGVYGAFNTGFTNGAAAGNCSPLASSRAIGGRRKGREAILHPEA